MFITPPGPGDDVRLLHRKIGELVDVVNALMNMTVLFEGQIRLIGKLEVRNGSCVLHIHQNTEVGTLGA
jgi:hypothetical protein